MNKQVSNELELTPEEMIVWIDRFIEDVLEPMNGPRQPDPMFYELTGDDFSVSLGAMTTHMPISADTVDALKQMVVLMVRYNQMLDAMDSPGATAFIRVSFKGFYTDIPITSELAGGVAKLMIKEMI